MLDCTYTNRAPGTIIVKKETLPDQTAGSFTFTGDAAGSISDGQSITVNNLGPGTYTSTETVPAGWDLTSILCDDSNSTGSGATATFVVAAGETVTCTFTNTKRGSIAVAKVTDPAVVAREVRLHRCPDHGEPRQRPVVDAGRVAPGTYTASELARRAGTSPSISMQRQQQHRHRTDGDVHRGRR